MSAEKIEKGVQKFIKDMDALEKVFTQHGAVVSEEQMGQIAVMIGNLAQALPGRLMTARLAGQTRSFSLDKLGEIAPVQQVRWLVGQAPPSHMHQPPEPPPPGAIRPRPLPPQAALLAPVRARVANSSEDPNAGQIIEVLRTEGQAMGSGVGVGFLGANEENKAETSFTD